MARIPYVTTDDLDQEHQSYLEYERKTPNVWRVVGNNQEVMGAFADLLEVLYEHAGLSDRESELVILTVSSTIGSEYQWHNHIRLATDLGVSEDEIAAIARDDRSPFSDREQALIAYARAIAGGQIEDPLHEAAAEYFDDSTIVGIATLAAAYVAFGRMLAALDVEIEDEEPFKGWSVGE